MSKGGGNTTVTQKSEPPAQFTQAYDQLLARGNQVAGQDYQSYPGNIVAPFSSDQQQAFDQVRNNQGASLPFIGAAYDKIMNSTTPLWNGVQQFSPQAVQQYSDPFTNSVVDATQAQFNNQNKQDQARLAGNAVSSGAWGGDRSGIAAAELSNQQQLAQAPVLAALRSQGYQTGLNAFTQQQGAQLGANQANAWLNSQAGYGLAGLGSQAQSARAQDTSNLLQTGAMQQQLGQENLNVPYYQWQAQQAYPFQTTNFLAGLTSGIGSAAGGTGTSSQNPSVMSQIGGLGLSGLGLYGMGAFDGLLGTGFASAGTVAGLEGSSLLTGAGSALDALLPAAFIADGGAVPSRARGGIADAVNDNDVPEGHRHRRYANGGIAAYDDGGDIVEGPVSGSPPLQLVPQGGIADAIGIPGGSLPTPPSGIAAAVPTNRFASTYHGPQGGSQDRQQMAQSIRGNARDMAMLQAGLGMLATGNFGRGALEGARSYQKDQDRANKIDEEAAQAQDTGAYRGAELDQHAQYYLSQADEAAARLKQQDTQFQATSARESAKDAAEAKYRQGLLTNDLQMRREAEAGTWTPYGTDPITQKPVLINNRTGETKLGSDPTTGKTGAGGAMSGRESQMFNRIVAAGNAATAAAKNIMELPAVTSSGWFANRGQGPGLFAAGKESLTNTLTSQDVQDYNSLVPGLTRNLGALETQGLAVPGSMTHSMEGTLLKEGDTVQTKLRKMAEMRQIVETNLEPSLSNPRVPQQEKELVQKIISQVQTAIPFTHHDITQLAQKGKPTDTIMSVAQERGLGGGPAAGTIEKFGGKSYRFKGGDTRDKSNWEMVQ